MYELIWTQNVTAHWLKNTEMASWLMSSLRIHLDVGTIANNTCHCYVCLETGGVLHEIYAYWTQNIFEHVLRRSERGNCVDSFRWGEGAVCFIAFPPSPYLDRLAAVVCICNGQRSSEISCDRCTSLCRVRF
jgi:hypothetical protein